jgi:hypothetical protein
MLRSSETRDPDSFGPDDVQNHESRMLSESGRDAHPCVAPLACLGLLWLQGARGRFDAEKMKEFLSLLSEWLALWMLGTVPSTKMTTTLGKAQRRPLRKRENGALFEQASFT